MDKAKLLISGLLLLTAAGVAGVAYVRSIDVDRYRPALVEELRAATGREVAIGGPVSLALLPRPRIVIRDVAVANAPWGTRDALARIDRVEAELALLPLLTGERRVSRVRLVRPDLWFETDSVGKVNWVLAGARGPADGKDALLTSLDVGQVDIKGGRITYRDGATGAITVLSLSDAWAAGNGVAAPLALSAAGAWNGVPFALDGTVGPFGAIAANAGKAPAVALQLKAAGATARIDGTMGDPRDGAGTTLKVALTAPEPAELARRFGVALPLAGRVAFDADLRYRPDRITVETATLAVGDRTATGTASIDLSKPRPSFNAVIHSPDMDVSAFLRRGTTVAAGEMGPLEALLDSGLLASADGAVDVRADILRAGPMTLRAVEAKVTVADGGVVVDPVRARSVGGVVTGSVRLDPGTSPPRLTAAFKAPAFAAGPLVQRIATVKAFGGVASIAANLSTTIGTPEAMLAKLEGDALLAMGEGRLTLEPYEAPFTADATGPAGIVGLMAAKGTRDVPIECIASRVKVSGGVARSDGFVLLSRDARVKGDGDIDLATGRMALRFIPEARDGPLLLERPVSLSGAVDAPALTLAGGSVRGAHDGALAFFPLRRFFTGLAANPAANACLRALPPPPRKRKASGRPIAQRTALPISRAAAPSPPPSTPSVAQTPE